MTARGEDRLRHRIEYTAFRLFRGTLRLLPAPVALGLGEALGWVAGVVFRMRRRVVAENLARAFPHASSAWRARVARGAYRHLGRESVATLRMAGARQEEVEASVSVDEDALEALRRDVEAGRGVVLVTGHLGNWEMGGAFLAASGIPVDAVVQVQRNRRFDEDLREVRERLGLTVMAKQDAPRGVLRSLRAGRAAALVADQNVALAGVFVDFFGVPAATARGPAVFSLRSDAPLWLGVALRTSRHPQRYHLSLERVRVEATGDTETDVERLTQRHTALLESRIRQAPEQYFWHHKRWKTRPPSREPASSGARINARPESPGDSR